MFTDIVGYTRLMGEDEQKALQLVRRNRSLHKSIIRKHRGKWLKEMGDGTLARFKTTSDAVFCAGELMRSSHPAGISLRIGIHQGEIIEEHGDIFGDGVSVASRLEPLAQPGQIIVSGPIHRNIKNKEGIQSVFIREEQLKNVDVSVKIYAIDVEENSWEKSRRSPISNLTRKLIIGSSALVIIFLTILGSTYFFNEVKDDRLAAHINSIAVLPFADLSPEGDHGYLGDGISAEIISVLAQVEELKVIGRTSSFSFKGQNIDLITIGKKLGVGTILEESVQKSGNQL